jgi:hypothetical protein
MENSCQPAHQELSEHAMISGLPVAKMMSNWQAFRPDRDTHYFFHQFIIYG